MVVKLYLSSASSVQNDSAGGATPPTGRAISGISTTDDKLLLDNPIDLNTSITRGDRQTDRQTNTPTHIHTHTHADTDLLGLPKFDICV